MDAWKIWGIKHLPTQIGFEGGILRLFYVLIIWSKREPLSGSEWNEAVLNPSRMLPISNVGHIVILYVKWLSHKLNEENYISATTLADILACHAQL